jgi:hypothetical protein
MPVYKSFWGSDPFYTSPDLSPHSRFITPQCGRLIQGKKTPRNISNSQCCKLIYSLDGLKPEEDLSKKPAPLFMAVGSATASWFIY